MSNPAWKMYVFREGSYEIAGAELVSRLREAIGCASFAPEAEREDRLLAALIAAGELECTLLDAGPADDGESSSRAAEITDALAWAFLTARKDSLPSIFQSTTQLRVPGRYRASVQEGFAYYALHPRKLALLLEELLAHRQWPMAREGGVRVLGIRSIGVTLSAVACAALGLHGVDCRRSSVRPTGHPYERQLETGPRLRQWLAEADASEFLIVDEGPGISGSSFLAVAEALEASGIARSRIHMIGSRPVIDPAMLLAPQAAERWPRYSFHAVAASPLVPDQAGEALSPADRQRCFNAGESSIVGSWRALEPAMFLSRDRQSTFCFAGLGHYGEAVCERARLVGDAGFAPRHLGYCRGFRQSAVIAGKTCRVGDHSPELLARMAAYLAWRVEAFAVANGQSAELEAMLRWNWQIEFGTQLSSAESRLEAVRVAVCDAQMMPAQWLHTVEGQVLKVDAGNHGDNHFFPGPCDIAWDVAGGIVEWELGGAALEYFVGEYTRRSGDPVSERLGPYLLAYATFRLAHLRMAAAAMQGEADELPLERDYLRYRAQALRLRTAHPSMPRAGQGKALLQSGLRAR